MTKNDKEFEELKLAFTQLRLTNKQFAKEYAESDFGKWYAEQVKKIKNEW